MHLRCWAPPLILANKLCQPGDAFAVVNATFTLRLLTAEASVPGTVNFLGQLTVPGTEASAVSNLGAAADFGKQAVPARRCICRRQRDVHTQIAHGGGLCARDGELAQEVLVTI